MQIFLSYASQDRELADAVQLALSGDRHQVFFDRDSLPPAGNYNAIIRTVVKQSDLFVFLISPDSVARGCYALTEMEFARRKWHHPEGRVLPVYAERQVPKETIPAYLLAVTPVRTEGNIPAAVVTAVSELEKQRRPTTSSKQIRSGTNSMFIVHYLEYFDREISSMSGLCVFSLMLGIVSVLLWRLFPAVSDAHLHAGAANGFAAALLFYLQKSHLLWLRGQIGLVLVRRDAGSFRLKDWLAYADGWGTWVRYRAGWCALFLSVACYVAAFVEGLRVLPLWLTLWGPLLLVCLGCWLQWHILTVFSDESEPFKEWLRRLTRRSS